jgi:hypothetical protein
MSAATVTERVGAGLALLDEQALTAVADVDLAWLDIGSSADCALGQVYGSYDRGLEVLGLSGRAAIDLGFTCAAGEHASQEVADAQFAELTAEWKRALGERRERVPA